MACTGSPNCQITRALEVTRLSRSEPRGRASAVLASARLAALAAGFLLLGGGAALLGVAARAALLAAVLRRVGRVGDLGGPLLRHALVLEGLVLLLVLDVRTLARHERDLPASRRGNSLTRLAAELLRPQREAGARG